jgi:hypothetical protein
MLAEPKHLALGAHPANLGGCLSHLDLTGNPTYLQGRSLKERSSLRFTVAGQRRIFTELPPLEELLSCRRTKPQGVGVGN